MLSAYRRSGSTKSLNIFAMQSRISCQIRASSTRQYHFGTTGVPRNRLTSCRGALGSGLAIFTRFPLIASQALPFSLSGTPQQPFDGDFFVNKAAGMVVIRHPLLGETEIWNTHVNQFYRAVIGSFADQGLDARCWRAPAGHETGTQDSTGVAACEPDPQRRCQRQICHCRESHWRP